MSPIALATTSILTDFQDLIRISVGTEHIDDIIGDFQQSFEAASATKTSGGDESNATATGTAEAPAKPSL
jgi:O-acetylhomoserine/O-acetylserine sulfhydrylase